MVDFQILQNTDMLQNKMRNTSCYSQLNINVCVSLLQSVTINVLPFWVSYCTKHCLQPLYNCKLPTADWILTLNG